MIEPYEVWYSREAAGLPLPPVGGAGGRPELKTLKLAGYLNYYPNQLVLLLNKYPTPRLS